MADAQEVEVTVDKPDEIVVETTVSAADPAVEVSTGEQPIEDLKRQYEELKAQDETRQRAIEAAEADKRRALDAAAQATREVAQARTEIASSELQSAASALAAAQAEADAAQKEVQSAWETGEFAKAAEAQRKLARAEAAALSWEREKQSLEQRLPRADGRVPQQQQYAPPADPFEARVAEFSGPTQEWLRKHREVVFDPERGQRAAWADAAAIKQGIARDSSDYFKFIERQMGYDMPETKQVQQRPLTAAPPSREGTNGAGKTGVKVVLSPGEVEAANNHVVWNTGPNKGKPVGVQEYARRKQLMQAEGLYKRGGGRVQ